MNPSVIDKLVITDGHAGDADKVKEDNLKAIAEHVVAEYESGALKTVRFTFASLL